MKLKLLLRVMALIITVFSPYSLISQVKHTSPYSNWKDWWAYTDAERDSLRRRWSEARVEEIFDSLSAGEEIRGINLLSRTRDWRDTSRGYDLRGISVNPKTSMTSDPDFRLRTRLRYAHWEGASLRGVNFTEGDFECAFFIGADLSEANFVAANMSYADMRSVRLEHAYLTNTVLRNVKLWDAVLDRAEMFSADLEGAELLRTTFRGTILSTPKMKDADFFRATFDTTYLSFAGLGEAKIRYIFWGEVGSNSYYIGEEKSHDMANSDLKTQITIDTYRDLESFYIKEGLSTVAKEFHFRGQEVATQSYVGYNPYRWARFLFMKLPYGYGSRPIWLLWYSLWLILAFTVIYAEITLVRRTTSGIYMVHDTINGKKIEEIMKFRRGKILVDCLYFSVLSFVTFGYGAIQPRQWLELFRSDPVEFKAKGWVRFFVGIEAALGIYLFALLVTVLFGKG